MFRENRSGRGSIQDAPLDPSCSLLLQAECRTGTRPTPSCGANRLLASGRPPPRSAHAAPAGSRHSSVAGDPDNPAIAFQPLQGALSVGRSYRSLRSHRAPGNGLPSVRRTGPLNENPPVATRAHENPRRDRRPPLGGPITTLCERFGSITARLRPASQGARVSRPPGGFVNLRERAPLDLAVGLIDSRLPAGRSGGIGRGSEGRSTNSRARRSLLYTSSLGVWGM